MGFKISLKLLFVFSSMVWSSRTLAASISHYTAYGSSVVKSESSDMWDKKNEAIKNAKKKLTYSLLNKFLETNYLEENKEQLEEEVVSFADRFILRSDILSHGLAEEENFKSYQATVKFSYSIESFKDLLRSKGILYNDLKNPKVAAFIEVLDLTDINLYKWWVGDTAKVHKAVQPVLAKLRAALSKEGYELLPIKSFKETKSLKEMALRMGAHYYVNGSIRVKRQNGKMNLNDGQFFFHEVLSQKLVSKIDVMKFRKALENKRIEESESNRLSLSRSVANTEDAKSSLQNTDVIQDSFNEAVRVMNAVGSVESLTKGLASIDVYGVDSPTKLRDFKQVIRDQFPSQVSEIVERKVENGKVTFFARTNISHASFMNLFNRKVTSHVASLKTDGTGIKITRR